MYATWKSYKVVTNDSTELLVLTYPEPSEYAYTWMSSPFNDNRKNRGDGYLARDGMRWRTTNGEFISGGHPGYSYGARPALHHWRIIINGLL